MVQQEGLSTTSHKEVSSVPGAALWLVTGLSVDMGPLTPAAGLLVEMPEELASGRD